MIDLIDECSYEFQKLGYKKVKAKKYDIDLLSLHIYDEKQSRETGFDKGDYYIINAPILPYLDKECFDYVSQLLKKRLLFLLRKSKIDKSETLLVGLGNPEIWADRLGVQVCNSQLFFDTKFKKICPNVQYQTGIETFDIVKALVDKLSITFVIVIDALCTNSLSRLGCSLQLTTTGMTPGSAINHSNNKICKQTIGVPCFSIGVPFMIDAKSFGFDNQLLLAPKDIKENVENISYIISKALAEVLR